MEDRKALLAGATGLIGGHLLDLLLAEPESARASPYGEIIALVRRPLSPRRGANATPEAERHRLTARVVDFDHLDEISDLPVIDDVFCCLGSTMKKAGSKAAFRKVDHDYVVATARLGLAAGARRFLLVSSIGADAESSNFYSRVKGEAEASVAELGYHAFHAFQPSILMGERDEKRPGERLGIAAAGVLNRLMAGPLRRYRGIRPETVAAAMAGAATSNAEGRQTYTYDDIRGLAGLS